MTSEYSSGMILSLTESTLYLVLAALFSLGVGSLIRTTADSITVVATVFFILTIAMQMLTMTGWEWVPAVAEWLPSELGSALAYASINTVSFGTVIYGGTRARHH